MGKTSICINCGKSVWLDERGWRHDYPNAMPICNGAEPGGGRTLSDFAKMSEDAPEKTIAFKRPNHGVPYAFVSGGSHLRELYNDGTTYYPRLTAEGLTATDWQEVKL